MTAIDRGPQIYPRLLAHVRPYAWIFGLAIAGMVALASTEWMMPALLKRLIDDDFERASPSASLAVPLLLVGLFALRGALNYVATISLHWISQRVVTDLRSEMFASLIEQPAGFFDRRSPGELVAKFTFDVTQVAQATTQVLTVLVKDSCVIIALLLYLFYLNGRLAALMMLFGPPVAFIVLRVSARMRDMSRNLQRSVGEINHVVNETIAGHRDIKVYAGGELERQRFARANNAARKFQMKVVRVAAANVPIIQLVVACGIALVVFLALRESGAGAMSRGAFVAFVTTTGLMLPAIKRLTNVNEFLQRGLAAADSVFALIDQPPEPAAGRDLPEPVRGELEFEHVDLDLDGAAILRDVDFKIEAGTTVAVVGPSGGGKSSLVSLVPRFYQPTAGEVRLDGLDLATVRLAGLRTAIAYVGQHVVLFNDTIRANIAYGAMRGAAPEAVEAAAAAAQVTAFAAQFPEGLDTVVGAGGQPVSGGQRARIAVARALLKNPAVLILDEASAALDAETEAALLRSVAAARAGRTTVFVTHRLAGLDAVDCIVVVDAGTLTESGTREALIAAGGTFARLAASTASDRRDPTRSPSPRP